VTYRVGGLLCMATICGVAIVETLHDGFWKGFLVGLGCAVCFMIGTRTERP